MGFFKTCEFYLTNHSSRVQPTIIFVDPCAAFVEKQTARFKKAPDANSNIDSFFHSKKEFAEMLKFDNNQTEMTWKRRILVEYTPRGNVVMHYDPYKMGFAYYSNQQGISYDILNAVAMKYVMIYKCYDFFMDTFVTAVESPLIKIHELEEKEEQKEKDSKDAKDAKSSHQDKNAPFVKFKSYNRASTKIQPDDKKVVLPNQPVEKTGLQYQNKFIFLGKMTNFSFIQKTVNAKKNRVFSAQSKTDLLDTVLDTGAQKTRLSYQEYKLQKRAPPLSE